MALTFTLRKMRTHLRDEVQYFLNSTNHFIHVNDYLDRTLTLKFEGYECLNCGRDKKIFRQGYCYDCFNAIPQAGDWIMKPELSKAHLEEEDRDLEYEKKVQLQPHIVYLANSSDIKVGVTRRSQVPTRWIDQGAHEAICVVETPNRYLAGITEVALKEHVSDKTNWRKMLRNDIEDVDLKSFRNDLRQYVPEEASEYFLASEEEVNISFPVKSYPSKPKSVVFPKTREYSGKLKGVKGQYLIFDNDRVMNIRNHAGFVVSISAN